MARIELSTEIAAPVDIVFDLARDIGMHERSMASIGEHAVAGRRAGLIGLDETVTLRARQFGLSWSMTSRITAFDRPRRFVDEMVSGPFRSFRHEHRFEPIVGGTRMIDVWEHVAPLGLLGLLADRLFLERRMRNLLTIRGQALAEEAKRIA